MAGPITCLAPHERSGWSSPRRAGSFMQALLGSARQLESNMQGQASSVVVPARIDPPSSASWRGSADGGFALLPPEAALFQADHRQAGDQRA